MSQQTTEVERGERFEFGKNWDRFLANVGERHIEESMMALRQMLGLERLEGLRFLDVGSGSGLSSLAARRLGATVTSFDYDPQSVQCTQTLRRQYFQDDPQWRVMAGSALDPAFMSPLGQFDVVYSWGVLHHTGEMWKGIENAIAAVAPGGYLFLAIYNDQGGWSRRWRSIKKTYNALPGPLKLPYAVVVMGARELRNVAMAALSGQIGQYVRSWTHYDENRGMSRWHDMIDWVGGYPFEVAKPEEIFEFCHARGFNLERLRTCAGGVGCNEYVFKREP